MIKNPTYIEELFFFAVELLMLSDQSLTALILQPVIDSDAE